MATREQLDAAVREGMSFRDDGTLDLDVPAILRALDIEPTQENIDDAAELLAEVARDQLPNSVVIVEP